MANIESILILMLAATLLVRVAEYGNVPAPIVLVLGGLAIAFVPDHIRGELGRPLELVMFGDFQCPFCLGAQSVLRRVDERLGERLVFAFRHLPIPERHPLAPEAAEASEAAAAQGRFWEYHDALFAAQPKLSRETMLEVGRDLGLDAERMVSELDSGAHRPRVERDLSSAEQSGATGTPTFFVNGARHYGAYDASSLVEALEQGTATN